MNETLDIFYSINYKDKVLNIQYINIELKNTITIVNKCMFNLCDNKFSKILRNDFKSYLNLLIKYSKFKDYSTDYFYRNISYNILYKGNQNTMIDLLKMYQNLVDQSDPMYFLQNFGQAYYKVKSKNDFKITYKPNKIDYDTNLNKKSRLSNSIKSLSLLDGIDNKKKVKEKEYFNKDDKESKILSYDYQNIYQSSYDDLKDLESIAQIEENYGFPEEKTVEYLKKLRGLHRKIIRKDEYNEYEKIIRNKNIKFFRENKNRFQD